MSDVPARVLRAAAPALERVGCDLDLLIAAHGLSPRFLWTIPGARIPWDLFAAILEDAGSRMGGPKAFDAIGADSLIWSWQTLIAILSRYVSPYPAFQFGVRFVGPAIFRGIRGAIHEIPGGIAETVVIPQDRRDSLEFYWLCFGVMRQFPTMLGWRTTSIEFEHHDHRGEYRIQFARMEPFPEPFEGRQSIEAVDRDLEELACLDLAGITHPHDDRCVSPEKASLSDQIRRILCEDERWHAHSVTDVARRLGMSERSLARHLAELGTTFRTVRDELKREIATSKLQAGASVEEVAESLGFLEVTSFYRAFHRWTGTPPGTYKRTVGSLPSGRNGYKSGA